jgi:hypothetical protein
MLRHDNREDLALMTRLLLRIPGAIVPVLKDLNDYLVAYGNDTMAALQAPDASGAPARIVCSLHTGVHTCARARAQLMVHRDRY